MRRRSGIGQGPQQVEDGANAEAGANGCDMAHGAVRGAGEQESDARLVDTIAEPIFRQIEFDTEGFQNISASRFRRHRAIAMLGHVSARSGNNNCAGSGGVETGPVETSGPARVQSGPFEHDFTSICAQGFGPCEQFSAGFAAHGQAHQKGPDLLRWHISCEDSRKGVIQLV